MQLRSIYDNGGATADRYFAIFADGGALAMSPNATAPNGVCMSIGPDEYQEGPHLGDEIHADEMPPAARRALALYALDWTEHTGIMWQHVMEPR